MEAATVEAGRVCSHVSVLKKFLAYFKLRSMAQTICQCRRSSVVSSNQHIYNEGTHRWKCYKNCMLYCEFWEDERTNVNAESSGFRMLSQFLGRSGLRLCEINLVSTNSDTDTRCKKRIAMNDIARK